MAEQLALFAPLTASQLAALAQRPYDGTLPPVDLARLPDAADLLVPPLSWERLGVLPTEAWWGWGRVETREVEGRPYLSPLWRTPLRGTALARARVLLATAWHREWHELAHGVVYGVVPETPRTVTVCLPRVGNDGPSARVDLDAARVDLAALSAEQRKRLHIPETVRTLEAA